MPKPGWGIALTAAALGTALLLAPAESRATNIRPGTISLGVSADVSSLGGGSYLARAFDRSRPGWQGHVRYRMRRKFVLGVTFAQQWYRPSATMPFVASGDSTDLERLTVWSAGVEAGKVFGSHEHPVYLLLGAGVWSPTAFAPSTEAYAANKPDRLYGSLTLGTEVFLRRSVTADLSLRALLHRAAETSYPRAGGDSGPTKLDHEIQLTAGLHFYVLD